MLVEKEKVQYELERMKVLFDELVASAKGNRPKFWEEKEELPDDFVFHINDRKYSIEELAEVDVMKLEACISRVNNEMKNLLKTVKRKL